MSRFETIKTPLEGLKVIKRQPIGDSRGYFERLFCNEELEPLLDGKSIMQINYSKSTTKAGVRGLHFQYPPYAEKKFVSCIKGVIFDVALDLRPDSKTFLHWHAEILCEDDHKTFLVPEGFAHGFQSLSDDCRLIYCCSAPYNAETESGINPMDPRAGIRWPMEITEISAKDKNRDFVNDTFAGVKL
ncbi:MAG: dTDP-4-dehydrorhamnose 3,5-epimerase family protein [Deltaproteobacteria bacterium]|nr:dTDP-4-dehydrorhamnose 3,5-epimerase family protein [Deltaproteobacteria bacterium]